MQKLAEMSSCLIQGALLTLFLGRCCTPVFGQELPAISIHGVVVHGTDRSPVPYCNIVWEGTGRGTISNELGAFVLAVDSLPARLSVSHVGYDHTSVTVAQASQPIEVALRPSTLQSVTVTARKAEKNGDILRRAWERTKKQTINNFHGRAFYRQLSKNDTVFNELYEIFFDTRFNADGINDWVIEQGRYALLERTKGERFVFNKNFTLINRIFPTMQPETDKYLVPIRPDAPDYFDIKMTNSFVRADGREIAVVAFSPKRSVTRNTPAMTGEVYIDLKTFDVLKLSGHFASNHLDVIGLQGEGRFDNYVLHYESAFKPNEQGDLLMDYIKVSQTADVLFENAPTRRLETNSLLTFYEHYVSQNKKQRLGSRLRFRQSDKDRINKLVYDPEFWRDNPIVKRTPVEDAVIEAFERDRQFGSIYLNNKNEVSLLPELDDDPVVKELTEKLERNIPVHEKLFLHTDKPYYARGETLWFKAYVTDAVAHRPYSISPLMFVELIGPDGKEVDSKKLAVQWPGFAEGDFAIRPGYVSGTYLLRAYTDLMRQYDQAFFFEKQIEVFTGISPAPFPQKVADLDFQLFPEGGSLVSDMPFVVAFKAVDEHGNPRAVEGYLHDENDDTLTVFESRHDGMGTFVVRTAPGRAYFVTVNDGRLGKTVPLPQHLDEGFAMSVSNRPDKNLTVRVLCSPSLDGATVYLIGQVRRHIYYKSKGTIKRQLLTFEVPKQVLPNGIVHLTLMDSLHRPLCERLAFINHHDPIAVEISPDKKKYGSGSPIEIDVRLRDADGNHVSADLSVAVTDGGQIQWPKYGPNMLNHLLLTSDLKGTIHEPGFYFDPKQPDAEPLLDLLLLTHGWRRFTWQQALRQTVSHKMPREGFDICGKMRQDDFEKYGRTVLTMIPLCGGTALHTASVDQRGGFCFSNVSFRDTCRVVVQVTDEKGKNHEISVELQRGSLTPNTHFPPASDEPGPLVLNYLTLNEQALQNQLYFDGQTISLEEVTVTGKKKERNKGSRFYDASVGQVIEMGKEPSVYADLLLALQGRVPGITVQHTPRPSIRFSNQTGEPLVVVDGMPTNQDKLLGAGAYELLQSLPISEVERVEILKGTNAATYGPRGVNGVIIVHTKKDQGKSDPILAQTFEGFYTAREFYVPKYDNKERKDLRSTLFWQPSLLTDKQGKATIMFPNSDMAKSFDVVVEGITADGQPVSAVWRHEWE